MKKGFTLLEVILTISLMAIVSVMSIKQLNLQRINNNIDDMIDRVDGIIEVSLLASTGYPSSTGDPCSSGYNYDDLSAVRINSCSDLNLVVTGETDPDSINGRIGTLSQIEDLKLLSGYSGTPILRVAENPNDSESFYLFLDFSSLTELSDRKKAYIEEVLESHLEREFTSNFSKVYRDATDVNVDDSNVATSGVDNDGKITIEFKN
jgi:prepilin-type N-terminal cleavage/methylation domain-containing protein